MREALGKRLTLFEIKGFQVHCDLVKGIESQNSNALATVKVTVNGQDILEAAEEIGCS